MNSRIQKAIATIEQENLDGIILSSPANISYLVKFPSRDSYLVVSKKQNFYITDSRYTEEAKSRLKGSAVVKKSNGSVFSSIAGTCLELGLKRIAFEERHLPFAEYEKIKEILNKKATLVPTHSLIEGLREIKEAQEIMKIKEAVRIAGAALKFIKRFILPGAKEIEVVAELERFIRYQGASNSAFDIIVASGPNSSFPHHIPSERKIKNGESVLVDIGADYLGYKSDLTRVFFLGKMDIQARKIYDIVLAAQEKAIKKIGPAQSIAEVDRAARQYISNKGYGGFFSHNLGHGVGLEVHEGPQVSGKENDLLRPGMVFTVEPAIYLPGKFGVRLEDMVLVTAKGCEVLSGVP